MATKVQGLDRLRKKLNRLPKEAKAEIGDAIEKGAGEMVALAKSLAPRKSGALRDSIDYTKGNYKPENSNVRGVTAAAGGSDISVTVHAGNAKAFYAAFVEFGTAPHINGGRFKGTSHPGTAAQPFFFPAWRALRKRIKGRISRATTKAAKKVAAGK